MSIRIDLSTLSHTGLKQGYLNGSNDYTDKTPIYDAADALLSKTKPGSWRFSGINGYGYGGNVYKFVFEDYAYDLRFGTSAVCSLQGIFNFTYGMPITIKRWCFRGPCFRSFAKLLSAWTTTLKDFLIATAGTRIEFFDVLAEPDATFVNVTPEQLYVLVKTAHDLVRQYRPEAKVVGPSLISYKPVLLDAFIRQLSIDGIQFDAISWHELGSDPDVMAAHVSEFKAKYPHIKIHISEYQGEDVTFIPGYTVGWLSALEKAGVDQANKACWGGDYGSPVTYESCWYGVSGLLMPDSPTPQPLYWVYKSYADMNGQRFAVSNDMPKMAVIAGPISGGVGVLLGNYGTDSGGVAVISDVAGPVVVTAYRIQNTFNRVTSYPELLPSLSFRLTPVNGEVSLPFGIASGDAYWVEVITNADVVNGGDTDAVA